MRLINGTQTVRVITGCRPVLFKYYTSHSCNYDASPSGSVRARPSSFLRHILLLDGTTVRLIVAGPIVESALLSVAACLFVLFLVESTPPVKNVLRKRGAERSSLHLK